MGTRIRKYSENQSATFILFYYSGGEVLPWWILESVPLVQAELVPICTKLHSMVGQRVHICAHEGPLHACSTVVHLWKKCTFQYKNIMSSVHPAVSIMTLYLSAGTSTPPGISATAVPSIAAPIGVNGFSALPPQSNGQPTSEPIYTNGIHPYPGEPIKVYIKETRGIVVTSTVLRLFLWHWHLQLAACTDGDLWMFDYSSVALDLKKNIT